MSRVGLLAPMDHELQPLVRALALEGDGATYRGRAGDVGVVALRTDIGMAAAAAAAERIVAMDIDWVIVVGIAGGVDPQLGIGDVVVPEAVVDARTGASYRPAPVPGITPRGTLRCGDDLILEPEALAGLVADDVVALDMETAAVAAVCERAGRPWSVVRAVSDLPSGGLVDEAILSFTRPDGGADPDALARYLDEDPGRLDILVQLARDMEVATEAAAAVAAEACRAGRPGT